MSKLSVLSLISKLRLINQLIKPNVRHVGQSSQLTKWNAHRSESLESSVYQNTVLRKNVSSSLAIQDHRSFHSSELNRGNDSDKSGKTLDQFRAEQERIEREYEAQQTTETVTTEQTNENNEEQEKIQEVRTRILDASLQFVKTHGWSIESISRGAESINYPGVAHGMFPNGAIELIHHFYAKCNRDLIEQLKKELAPSSSDTEEKKPTEAPNPKDFATKAIRMRLEMIIPYIDTWPQAMGIMTLPQNVPTSLAQLLTLVDDICYCVGDRSVDIGWYTRRIGIASIYKMVELFMLQDKSPDHQKTWEFLERRVDEGVQIQEFLINSDQKTKTMTKALDNVFQTARNILGINCGRR